MPFDAPRHSPTTAARDGKAPILYVLPTTEGGEADGLISAEVNSLRQLGCTVVPFAPKGMAGWIDPDIALEAAATDAAVPHDNLARAARNPFGLARATRLALAQQALRAAEAMQLGARVAAAARQFGCGSIHAVSTDSAATAALIGGRMTGLRVTMASQGGEIYRHGDDLALKLRAAAVSLAACTEMADDFRNMAPRATVRALHRGIDAEWFAAASRVQRNGRVLCLAPLVPRSGISTLLAAIGELPRERRLVVDVIGGGPLLEALRAEALERDVTDHVRFLGTRGRRWVAEEGQHYLGLVAPGIVAPDGDRDPAPVAVLQAMALQLPVLASSLMGLREIVQVDSGHLVPPGEAVPLARGLRWLSLLPEAQRRQLGQAGRDRVLSGYTMADRAAALVEAVTARAA